jgi:uncharacterized lipoprotein YddW (UPF0748 family)
MKLKSLLLALCALCLTVSAGAQVRCPKREFRGAWIQCVNGQFQGMSPSAMQQTLTSQLDVLKQAGINAIIFQVRAEGDALYASPYEPWSRFLTGVQGRAPQPAWDPLQFMIDECHKRGMELHAWINPYRAKTKGTTALSPAHPYNRYPERFVSYGGQLYFDPGLPENRKYICAIVRDIVKRYDVDAIHMDDYFYPYPNPGESFPDNQSFAQYGRGYSDRGDWRRDNVNVLIKELHQTVHDTKPWVKFGVSPFGIYRNKQSDPNGSDTRGLQNYDDLYADVLLWVNNGWVDYNIPQIYWEIGHKSADYETLIQWWARNASARPLYIGQDVMRTVGKADLQHPDQHQLAAKMRLQRSLSEVQGSCQWYAAAVVENPGNYRTMLEKEYHRYPALVPTMPFIDDDAPSKVKSLKVSWTSDGPVLFWTAPKAKNEMDRATRYVVYRFAAGEKLNIHDASHIVEITGETHYTLPYTDGKTKYVYVVTAVDRLHNESGVAKTKVKL